MYTQNSCFYYGFIAQMYVKLTCHDHLASTVVHLAITIIWPPSGFHAG
jgi:hypothetical protein